MISPFQKRKSFSLTHGLWRASFPRVSLISSPPPSEHPLIARSTDSAESHTCLGRFSLARSKEYPRSSKGISASALPYKRTRLSWLKISSQDVRTFSAAFVCFCGIMGSL
ncbi:hypothetical protein EUGRSUZ_A00410 [Eucalyptus grandis]|uniref:Uncharacterized protein n=2 Tax=Eucalyptus grandis TaxID=71139 RepID=A0ACC3LZJ1_EUCGR|nr:hypothetical protein EUGRSUZ_A00410 [Eucalyptus grandis]